MYKYATIKIEERMANMLETRLHHTFHLSFLLSYPTTWIYVKQDFSQLFPTPKVPPLHLLLIDVVRMCTHTSKRAYLLTMFTSLWFSWMGVAKVRKSTRGRFLLIHLQVQILNFFASQTGLYEICLMATNIRINLVPMVLVLHEYMTFVESQENQNPY